MTSYEYTKNGEKYKRFDRAYNNFNETTSEVYKLINDRYKKLEVQYTKITENGNIEVKIDSMDNKTKSWVIYLDKEYNLNENKIETYANNYDWITEESNGSKYIGNLGRTAIIAAIGTIAGNMIGGPIGSGVVAAVGAIADKLFNGGNEYVYYHKIYNWKHCERDWRVIEETEYTRFYEDAYHRFLLKQHILNGDASEGFNIYFFSNDVCS